MRCLPLVLRPCPAFPLAEAHCGASQGASLMVQTRLLRLSAALALVAGSGLLSAAQITLPSNPARQFGASVTPAYEGWFDNPDGSHSFLIGYYNRNTQAEIDIPIGPNNRFEPGNPDQGQPTHFLTRRRFGMFVVIVPKAFTKTQKITWTLVVNGVTSSIPFLMHTDYNITPTKSSEESPNRDFNTPPVLRFEESGAKFAGPLGSVATALQRTATAGTPMPLAVWADDDALYSSGGNGPLTGDRPPVILGVTKYRGPGTVTVNTPVKFKDIKGGKPLEPYSGTAATTVTFSEPGDYLLHINGGDQSGNGGGGSGCCWTTVMMKVTVTGTGSRTGGGQ
jgi:hypothetical protein